MTKIFIFFNFVKVKINKLYQKDKQKNLQFVFNKDISKLLKSN